MRAILQYNRELAHGARDFSTRSWQSGEDEDEPVSARGAEHMLLRATCWPRDKNFHERLFYLILRNNILRGNAPYPLCDECLFLANATALSVEPNTEIHMGSLRFLPVAILLAALGYEITLSADILYNKHPSGILTKLLNMGHDCERIFPGPYKAEAFLLDYFSDATFQNLAKTGMSRIHGLLMGQSEELCNARYAKLRRQLVRENILKAILEYPGGKSRTSLFAMKLSPAPEKHKIHFARLHNAEFGEGALNQQWALPQFLGNDENDFAVNVSPQALGGVPACNLSWAALNRSRRKTSLQDQPRLGELARILRCQLARTRLGNQDGPGAQEALAAAKDGGKYIAREVNQQHMDPLTGILSPVKGTLVRIAPGRESSIAKFFLRANDILFAFRGTRNGIGASGFVQTAGTPAIPARHIYIIRALPGISAIWLYYMLKTETTRNLARSFATGAPQLAINLELLRELPIAAPRHDEIERVESAHAQLAADLEEIDLIHARMTNTLKLIEQTNLRGRTEGAEIFPSL